MVIFFKSCYVSNFSNKNTSRLPDFFIGDVIWCMVDTRTSTKKKGKRKSDDADLFVTFVGEHTKIVLEKMSLNAQIAAHLMSVQPLVTCSIIFC